VATVGLEVVRAFVVEADLLVAAGVLPAVALALAAREHHGEITLAVRRDQSEERRLSMTRGSGQLSTSWPARQSSRSSYLVITSRVAVAGAAQRAVPHVFHPRPHQRVGSEAPLLTHD